MSLDNEVQQEAAKRGFFGGMKDKVTDYASRAGQKARTAAAIATVLAGGFLGSQKAEGAIVDPLDLVDSNPTFTQTIADPHGGASGTVSSMDYLPASDGGLGDLVVLYDSGRVDFYKDAAGSLATTPYKSWGSLGTTGISAIDSKYGGELAITDSSGVGFYDLDGNFQGGINTGLGNITDLTYDVQRDRILLLTSAGSKIPDTDGSTSALHGASGQSLEFIDMTEDNLGNVINDMQTVNSVFYRMAEAGNIVNGDTIPVVDTNFPTDSVGMTFSPNHAFAAVPQGIVVYDTQPFQDNMSYAVPEPSALIMGLVGLAGIAAGRTGRKQYQRMEC